MWNSANLSSTQWEFHICGDTLSPARNVSYSDLGEHKLLIDAMCRKFPHGTWCHGAEGELISVPSGKFTPLYFAEMDYHSQRERNSLHVCSLDARAMRYDPDFVKAVYLGIDLPLRYAIPCLILVFLNISLVVSVRKGNRRHTEITKTAKKSLFNLPVLRSVVGIVSVFLGCHTGGIGLFILDIFRVFENGDGKGLRTTVNVFLHKDQAITGLEMKGSAFLLAAVNSAVNILLYCFFLPAFGQKWVSFFSLDRKQRLRSGIDVQDLVRK